MKANTAGLFSLSHTALSHSADDQPPAAPTNDAQDDRPPRVRTTTLDRFNQEMSVLDQPLDGEVEFYDEPQPRRWRVRAIGVAIFALSFGGYLTVARYRHAPQVVAREPSAPPAAAEVVAAVPTPPSAPAVAREVTTAEPASEKPETAGADEPAAPSKPIALHAKADGHHHHHSRHASGHHHHGGHAHHV